MTTNQILAGVAVLQLGLVALTWWPRSGEVREATTLVELSGDIDKIVVEGRNEPGATEPVKTVELGKQGGDWVVTTAHSIPADGDKVGELIDKFRDLTVRIPVASHATSHASLNVTEDDHARRVTLHAGDQSVTLIVGSASGQAANVRLQGEDEVYPVKGWNAWSIGERNDQYWDNKLLDVEPEAIDSLTVTRGDDGFTLAKGPDGWTAAGEETLLDPEEVDALLKVLANLRMADVEADAPLEATAARVEWTGDQVRGAIDIGVNDGRGNTPLRVDGKSWLFQVPNTSVKRWVELTLEDLEELEEIEIPPELQSPH